MKTFQEVRSLLSVIESDEKMFSQITEEDIPSLKMLLKDSESWRSARAVFALSRLKHPEAHNLVKNAIKDKRNEVRVAIAVASTLLPIPIAEQILNVLLKDKDMGVKEFAIDSISTNPSKKIKNQLQKLSLSDVSDYIKTISIDKLSKIK
jgi:HEAT repeat protein